MMGDMIARLGCGGTPRSATAGEPAQLALPLPVNQHCQPYAQTLQGMVALPLQSITCGLLFDGSALGRLRRCVFLGCLLTDTPERGQRPRVATRPLFERLFEDGDSTRERTGIAKGAVRLRSAKGSTGRHCMGKAARGGGSGSDF